MHTCKWRQVETHASNLHLTCIGAGIKMKLSAWSLSTDCSDVKLSLYQPKCSILWRSTYFQTRTLDQGRILWTNSLLLSAIWIWTKELLWWVWDNKYSWKALSLPSSCGRCAAAKCITLYISSILCFCSSSQSRHKGKFTFNLHGIFCTGRRLAELEIHLLLAQVSLFPVA